MRAKSSAVVVVTAVTAVLTSMLGAGGAGFAQAHTDHDCAPPPALINLPPGFQPEGITAGRGDTLYVANFNDGSVFAAHAQSGAGAILVPPQAGRAGLGIKLDHRTNFLFVAGGGTGQAFVYDAETGDNVASFALASAPTFINDVVLTEDAAYFTDSFRPVFYRLPLGRHGRLPSPAAVRTIPLGGDYVFQQLNPDGTRAFNANGIEVSHGQLIIVNSVTGKLYSVDPDSGDADEINLGGSSVANGDGLVLRGRTLYVVENFSNQVAVVRLSRHLDRGEIVETIADPNFDIPATAARLGDALFVTNARFTTPHTDTTPYHVVRVPIED